MERLFRCFTHGRNLNVYKQRAISKHHCPVSHHVTQFTIPALGPRTSNPSSNIAWAGGVASGLCWQEGRAEISRRQRGVMSCRNRGALIAANLQVSVSNSELFSTFFLLTPIFWWSSFAFVVGFPLFHQKNSGMYSPFASFFATSSHQLTHIAYI